MSVTIVSAIAGGELVAGYAVAHLTERTACDEQTTGDAVEQTRERPQKVFADDG